MFWMLAYPVWGQVGGGWALEIESFLGTVKWHRADRRVPFGAKKTRDNFKKKSQKITFLSFSDYIKQRNMSNCVNATLYKDDTINWARNLSRKVHNHIREVFVWESRPDEKKQDECSTWPDAFYAVAVAALEDAPLAAQLLLADGAGVGVVAALRGTAQIIYLTF